ECAAGEAALRAPGFSAAPNAVRALGVRCEIEDRERSRRSSIVSEKARKCECFLTVNTVFLNGRDPSEMFYAAGSLRCQLRRGRASARSIPFTSMASSSARIDTVRAPLVGGQWNLPRSSRFAQTHKPLPSHTNAFNLVRVRLLNRNKWPLSGSCPN